MADDIPTPEEITRVVSYMQRQTEDAQEAVLTNKRVHCVAVERSVADAMIGTATAGVEVARKGWDDTSVPWKERGDATELRIDLPDGSQVFVRGVEGSARIDISFAARTV